MGARWLLPTADEKCFRGSNKMRKEVPSWFPIRRCPFVRGGTTQRLSIPMPAARQWTIRHRPGERQAQPQRTMALMCPCPSIHDAQRPNIGGAFQLDATGSLVKRLRRLGCGHFGLRHSAASGGYVINGNAAECLHGVVPLWRTTFGSCIVLRQPES